MDIEIPSMKFDCLFTSMPFDWFRDDKCSVKSYYVRKFKELLLPNGFILLDSLPTVNREEYSWPVASRQSEYLERFGFNLVEVIVFKSGESADGSNESVIMKFLK